MDYFHILVEYSIYLFIMNGDLLAIQCIHLHFENILLY